MHFHLNVEFSYLTSNGTSTKHMPCYFYDDLEVIYIVEHIYDDLGII